MPSLLTGVDLDALLDQEDCVRRVVAQATLPHTIAELEAALRAFSTSGMATRLPSKKLHAAVCDVPSIVADAVESGWLHPITGKKSFRDIAEHADGLKSTLSHDFPLEGGGRHNRVLDWADVKDHRISEGQKAFDLDATADHYVLTHAGFEAITGHKQGERPVAPVEVVDPADIQPASIGDA